MSLTDQLAIAVANKDVDELKRLLHICDSLHKGKAVEGYTSEDLPPDDNYEEALRAYRSLTTVPKPTVELLPDELDDLYMPRDAIIKDSVARMTGKVICLPKYDGVSCAVRFVRNGARFVIDKAVTRGVDHGFNHKNTDMTATMTDFLKTCTWIRKLSKVKAKQLTVRGEIVLIDKTACSSAPASFVAGLVNSKSKVLDPDHVLGFKLFEITRYIKEDGTSMVPTQLQACSIISKLDGTIPYVIVDLPTNGTDTLMKLYDEWQSLDAPIDGVVYCEPDWHYPHYASDVSSKAGYGKYALKPNLFGHALFKEIEYTIAKDGLLSPIVHFEPVMIQRKTYQTSKVSTATLIKMMEDGLHKGSTLELKVAAGIMPAVTRVIDNSNHCYMHLPTDCPFCKSALKRNDGKIPTIRCTNERCIGVVAKYIVNMVKVLQIAGYGEITVMKLLKSGTYEDAFRRLDASADLKGKLSEATVANVLCALSIATRTSVSKTSISHLADRKLSEVADVVKTFLESHKSVLVELVLPYI